MNKRSGASAEGVQRAPYEPKARARPEFAKQIEEREPKASGKATLGPMVAFPANRGISARAPHFQHAFQSKWGISLVN